MPTQYNSLVDWATTRDPKGNMADIAYLLSQHNAIFDDMIFVEGNEALGHKTTMNVGLPQGTWKGNNQFIGGTKPLYSQAQFSIGILTSYSITDKDLAELNGDVRAYRYGIDMAHIEGLSQQVAQTEFYGNENTVPGEFTGILPYYSSLSTAVAQSANNVIDGGGTGSSNASLILVSFGNRTSYNIFPKGSTAGLIYDDKGDITPQINNNGERLEVYTSMFKWKIGYALEDWRYNVRIANLDTTETAGGLFSSTPPDLYTLMISAVNKIPSLTPRASNIVGTDAPSDPMPGNNISWHCNRTVKTALEIQAIRNRTSYILLNEVAGAPAVDNRGIPIRVNDSLISNEAQVV